MTTARRPYVRPMKGWWKRDPFFVRYMWREVTALGDEANEAARIEACATGGKALASKSLIERLNRTDADALGLDTRHTKYTPLADLSTATDKARRDAPSIAVCEI